MQFLASIAMRGRSQAVMLTTVLAMLSLLLPPLSILSSAVVALVTLRKGAADGALVVVLAGLASAFLAWITLGQVVSVAGFLLLLWAPVWLLSLLLRNSRSLGATLAGGLVLGLLIILGQYLQTQDLTAAWRDLLQPFAESLVEAQLVQEAQRQDLEELLNVMAYWMPGIIAAGFFLQSMFALLLGRWWQAVLYNPGGFRGEFHRMRMHRILGYTTLLVLVARLLSGVGDSGLLDYLVMLLLAGWFLQGLALVHGSLAILGAGTGWLVAMYCLILLVMPQAVTVLAAAGFADVWIDLRARLIARGTGGRA